MASDKVLHYAACLILTLGIGWEFGIAEGIALTMVVGYLRERFGNKDWLDMDANVAGMLTAVLVLLGASYL